MNLISLSLQVRRCVSLVTEPVQADDIRAGCMQGPQVWSPEQGSHDALQPHQANVIPGGRPT